MWHRESRSEKSPGASPCDVFCLPMGVSGVLFCCLFLVGECAGCVVMVRRGSEVDDGRADEAGGGRAGRVVSGGAVVRRAWSRRWVRVLVALVVVVVAAVGVGGWLWWTRPWTRSVPLPAGVERGEYVSLGGSDPSFRTAGGGDLSSAGMQSENHEWVAEVRWRSRYGPRSKSEIYRLHLGESVHIDGLGTLTLLAVNPAPITITLPDLPFIGPPKARPSTPPNSFFNLNLDPGVDLEWWR